MSLWFWFALHSWLTRASLVAQRLKRLPAMQETWVWSLGWEDPLEKEMATHSSILAWRIPWTEEPGGLQSTGWQRIEHDWAISLSLSFMTNDVEHLFTGWWAILLWGNVCSVSIQFLSVLFVCFWLCWVFVASRAFSLVAAIWGYSLVWCAGFSLQWLLLLQSMGSRACGLRSCSS